MTEKRPARIRTLPVSTAIRQPTYFERVLMEHGCTPEDVEACHQVIYENIVGKPKRRRPQLDE